MPFPKNRKINFLIAGAQKSGTSALWEYLREHPEICLPEKKEIHFFDNDKFFSKKKIDYTHYHSFFKVEKQHKMIGETTPIYMYWMDAPKRIWQYNPEMKMIIILRNPIDRAYSHWNMQRDRGLETLSFSEAIRKETERARKSLPSQQRFFSYTDRGFYSEQIRRIWRFFEENNILIFRIEDLKRNPEQTLESVCRFLKVSSFPEFEKKNVHSRKYVSKMDKKDKDHLRQIFEFEIKSLERMFQWDCSDWLA